MAHQMIATKKMIGEIIPMAATPGSGQAIFTVRGKVISIYPHAGWCYVTCHQCSKKVQAIDGVFVCTICDCLCPYPMIRYRIHVCVSDKKGTTIFTIFNKLAEKLLDSSANKFLDHLTFDTFPLAIHRLFGRTFVFRVRLPDYDHEDYDFHNYRVVELFEVDPTPQLDGYVFAHEKVGVPDKRLPTPLVTEVAVGSSPSKAAISVERSSCSKKKRGRGPFVRECDVRVHFVG